MAEKYKKPGPEFWSRTVPDLYGFTDNEKKFKKIFESQYGYLLMTPVYMDQLAKMTEDYPFLPVITGFQEMARNPRARAGRFTLQHLGVWDNSEIFMCRHERLKGTPSDVAPILWQNGALARLKKGETIDKLLFNGYSTISLGYAGLCECVRYMTGKSHTDPEATPFALEVMEHLNEACRKWAAETNISFSLYGTPLESTTYKFAKKLQDRFGIIPGVTDKNYITNSYHVHVTEPINAFDKLTFEAQFQELSPGGAISYVEVPNMQNNIEAVLAVMQHIYDHIMYAELNTKSDYCQVCGYDGEIQIIEDEHKKLIWECPHCGNRDQNKMNVARRTCGYIGTQFWNQGRTQEIRERVMHL